jgi:hypothetical protein
VSRLASVLLIVALLASFARADEITFRGNYWRDRNTRVIQPEAQINKELPSGTMLGAHYLLDAITSASVAAGVQSDQPFTELRNEFGASLGQRLGDRAQISASYSYSSESDYWAQLFTVNGAVDLFQRNTTLALTLAYGHDNVGQRMGPTAFSMLGSLDSVRVIAGWTQVITPTFLANFTFDSGVVGFGSKDNGFQANPYRTVLLGGSPSRESVPFQRIRLAWALALHWVVPLKSTITPWVAFRPSYRIYWDDWGIVSSTPELRTFIPIGPTELRVGGRYYTQTAASFWREQFGLPAYVDTAVDPVGSTGAFCTTCLKTSSHGVRFFSADPKLSKFSDVLLDVQLLIKLRGLRKLSRWVSDGYVSLYYGHLFEGGYPQVAFGDAELAGLQFTFPL